MARWPQHVEKVKVARCCDCGRVQPLVAHWGPAQQRRLCMLCNETAWRGLLGETGRLAQWDAMLRGAA